jgi:hypothetical protein
MAKKAGKPSQIDTVKLQQIIGRALTDQKFAKRLSEKGALALAEYELDKDTLALVQRGLKMRGEIDSIASELEEDFGLKYQAV